MRRDDLVRYLAVGIGMVEGHAFQDLQHFKPGPNTIAMASAALGMRTGPWISERHTDGMHPRVEPAVLTDEIPEPVKVIANGIMENRVFLHNLSDGHIGRIDANCRTYIARIALAYLEDAGYEITKRTP